MSQSKRETNPFYALVVLSGVAFAVTTLAYVAAIVREDQPAAGEPMPVQPSPVFEFFAQRGEILMLWEAGTLTVTGLLAMGLDRWKTWRNPTPEAPTSPIEPNNLPS